jgi:hypothetical protein
MTGIHVITVLRMFSLVPFAAFIVLAGDTIASASASDLALLANTVEAIEPMAASSSSNKKLFDVCKTFYHIAYSHVSQRTTSQMDMADPGQQQSIAVLSTSAPLQTLRQPYLYPEDAADIPLAYGMEPHSWEAVATKMDLETEVDVAAMASFLEPYMPFDPRHSSPYG